MYLHGMSEVGLVAHGTEATTVILTKISYHFSRIQPDRTCHRNLRCMQKKSLSSLQNRLHQRHNERRRVYVDDCPSIPNWPFLNTMIDAEYCTLRAEAEVLVPDHADAAKYAPILCAGVTVLNSIQTLNVPAGSTVAIQGLGGLGHLALQYANKFGYRVVAISRDSKKEEFTRKLGVHE